MPLAGVGDPWIRARSNYPPEASFTADLESPTPSGIVTRASDDRQRRTCKFAPCFTPSFVLADLENRRCGPLPDPEPANMLPVRRHLAYVPRPVGDPGDFCCLYLLIGAQPW